MGVEGVHPLPRQYWPFVTPAGSASVNVAFFAMAGPPFVTVTFQMTVLPAPTLAGPVLTTERSADALPSATEFGPAAVTVIVLHLLASAGSVFCQPACSTSQNRRLPVVTLVKVAVPDPAVT